MKIVKNLKELKRGDKVALVDNRMCDTRYYRFIDCVFSDIDWIRDTNGYFANLASGIPEILNLTTSNIYKDYTLLELRRMEAELLDHRLDFVIGKIRFLEDKQQTTKL